MLKRKPKNRVEVFKKVFRKKRSTSSINFVLVIKVNISYNFTFTFPAPVRETKKFTDVRKDFI